MGDDISIEEIERRVGRNVIIFQRLEAVLKQLLARSSLQGNLADIPGLIADRERALKMQTLGNLSVKYALEVHRQAPKEEPEESPDHGPEFSFKFYLDSDPEFIEKKKSELASLVQGRNDLIHQHLACYDEKNYSHREVLAEYLERQYRQLVSEYFVANQLISSLTEGMAAASDLLLSELNAEDSENVLAPNNSLQARRP